VGRTPVKFEKARAELGLLSMTRRRLIADLVYYWKLLKMPENRLQGQFARFLRTDIGGVGSSRNWVTEHVLPVLDRWKLSERVNNIKLEDWRRLLREKAYAEEKRMLEEKCEESKVEQVIFDYRKIRNGHNRVLPMYLQGWAPKRVLQSRMILTNIRLKTLPLGCRRGWAGGKSCPLCGTLKKSELLEDEEHLFAGGCPFMSNLYIKFRERLTDVLRANRMKYDYDMEDDMEGDVLGIKLMLFSNLIWDEHGPLFPVKVWGLCQDLFQQFIGQVWALRKELMEAENGDKFVKACEDLIEAEDDGYWSDGVFDGAREIVQDPTISTMYLSKIRESRNEIRRQTMKKSQTRKDKKRIAGQLSRKVGSKKMKRAREQKVSLIGMIIRGEGDGDSGIVMDMVGKGGLFRVALEPWGTNYEDMTEDEVRNRSTKDRLEVPDFTRLGREVEVELGGELVKGVVDGYYLDNEVFGVRFEREVMRTWEIPLTERQIPWEVRGRYWTMKGVSVDAILRPGSFRELTPAAGQVPGSSRRGEAS